MTFQPAPTATTTNTLSAQKPTIPSKRQSAFEVYRKPIPLQVSPVILDQEKKAALLEEMLRNLNCHRDVKAGGGVIRGGGGSGENSTVQQLRDQNALLVNVCLELSNELFALKYKREEIAQRLQQVDALNRTIDASTTATGSGGGGGVSAIARSGGNNSGGARGGAAEGGQL